MKVKLIILAYFFIAISPAQPLSAQTISIDPAIHEVGKLSRFTGEINLASEDDAIMLTHLGNIGKHLVLSVEITYGNEVIILTREDKPLLLRGPATVKIGVQMVPGYPTGYGGQMPKSFVYGYMMTLSATVPKDVFDGMKSKQEAAIEELKKKIEEVTGAAYIKSLGQTNFAILKKEVEEEIRKEYDAQIRDLKERLKELEDKNE